MAPWVSAGFKVNSNADSKVAISLESAQPSIESKRSEPVGPEKRFFQANP